MGIPFLDAILGKLYSRGVEKELRGGLNFGPGFLLAQSALGWDITPDPAVYVAAMRDTVSTTDATPTLLTGLTLTVPEFTAYRVEARFYGRELDLIFIPSEKFKVLSAVYRRVEDAGLALWGSVVTGTDLEDDAAWGEPELVISGNTLTPRVTGKVGENITWTVDLVVRAY